MIALPFRDALKIGASDLAAIPDRLLRLDVQSAEQARRDLAQRQCLPNRPR